MTRTTIVALLACITPQSQFKPGKTRKFLTVEGAGAFIGAGTKLDRAIGDGCGAYS
jgi:hypothetical protein